CLNDSLAASCGSLVSALPTGQAGSAPLWQHDDCAPRWRPSMAARQGLRRARMAVTTMPNNARAAAARARYVTDTVETVSPQRLVTMLYDALVRDLTLAEEALGGRPDLRVVNDRLVHAQAIVLELQAGLDPTKWSGGPGLARLYSFLHDELVRANIEKDALRVASCRLLVEPLRQAWHDAADALAKSA